jgi:hypothetical protein
MFIGIAIFVGGMIAIILIMKYLKNESAQAMPQQPIESIIPLSNPMLMKINDSINNQVPVGKFETRALTITDVITMLDEKRDGGLNYTNADIINNGPNPVYFSVNSSDWPEAPLPVGQTINVDFKNKGRIKKIYFRCNKGETANIYLYILK